MVPTERRSAVPTGQNRTVDRTRRVAVTVEQSWHRVPGGTATSTLGLLRALAERSDLDLVGVAARHRESPPSPFDIPVPVRHLPLPRVVLYEAWHALRRPSVESATGPVDVVHATAVAVPPTEAPLVMTIHDLAFLADPSQATRHGNRFFRRGTELARRHARLVLVPSEVTAAECRDAGFDVDRIRVVPWGVDHPVDRPATEPRPAASRPYVLFVGTIEPRKNLAGVIAGMASLAGRDVDLVIAGPDGWNEDLEGLMARLEGTGIGVRRVGMVGTDRLAALYRDASVLCYPSLREGFGLPVLEAMAHGTPVVTSLGTATAEVGGDAVLLVDPADAAAIGSALASVLDDPKLARDLSQRGIARAATYTWERTAALTAAAYEEVAP